MGTVTSSSPCCGDLAVTYKYAGRLIEAEALYWQVLVVLEAALGREHPDVAAVWHNLGGVRHAGGDLTSAERFARQGWPADRRTRRR